MESQNPNLESFFFFRLESHGIRRFFPWNPKESRRFFLESQGIYTSLDMGLGSSVKITQVGHRVFGRGGDLRIF